ncbi:calpain-2 catalytic subunit [Xenopus laevis]|uniref:Calpain-2 catalytic subunit n=2 Tax=Xenopus laevis TaxID=8355 RepID=A0A1L8F903_XENLA|nr:calpain-2 catalytic subunit [Xenopus laevis]OCT68063.1 hypothetical protein XELAEV_18039359mg [Xenopus laevis]
MPSSAITVRLLKEENPSTKNIVSPYLGKDYHKLVQECLQQGRLFEDANFPAESQSLGYDQLGPFSENTRGIKWKRPQEICQSPQFICEDMKWTDVCQGELGNCWFLAAAASLTQYPLLKERVVPPQQSFESGYAGIFHFQFWQYGEWVDVVVDDRLPVKDGKLVFVSSAQKSEFWAALLEKAYAKLNGSYEALGGGFMNEAFVDFTGGLGETVKLKEPPPNLFYLLQKAVKKKSLMGAFIQAQSQSQIENQTPEGLVKGHAYSIIATWEIQKNSKKISLLRLRNPWGRVEWKGNWSDDSALWSEVDPEIRQKLQVRSEDGEFWIQMEDFLRFFDILEVCNLTPESVTEESAHLWKTNTFCGRWVGHSAGGCRTYKDTFWTNPQFLVTLTEQDEEKHGKCTLLVSLMQKNRRQGRAKGRDFLSVGFEIYQVPKEFDNKMCASERRDLFSTLESVASCSFMVERDVTGRYQLPPGQYLLIPSTFQPHQESDFILRIFTEKQHKLMEIDCEIRANENVFKEPALKGTMEEFTAHFARLSGQDKEISPEELQRIMMQITFKHPHLKTNGFSLDICRLLVKMADLNSNGKLQLEEFRKLWSKIKEWEKIFTKYDKDRSGAMDVQELRLALEAAGFTLNNRLIESLCQKYGNTVRQVYFDSFLSCLAYLVCVFEQCRAMDKNKDGVIGISKQEWLQLLRLN